MGAAPPPQPSPPPDLTWIGAVANWLFTKFGPTDFILIAVILGMMCFWTGFPLKIPNPTLDRVQHIETIVSRLCSHDLCKPDDDACKEACWH